MNSFTLKADGLGLVVPMNVEAMCVGSDTGAIFEQAPYNFSKLPNASDGDTPNLSNVVMSGGLVSMEVGVHLHWALPDGLTNGDSPQDNTGSILFPNVPDRWLVTRVFTDLTDPQKPVNRVKSWVIESNYVSPEPPDPLRKSISVPFKEPNAEAPQYRYIGRVQEFETWRAQYLMQANGPGATLSATDNYVEGLNAVGYGVPEFSASYQSCKSLFGFYDMEADIDQLAAGVEDYIFSYHVVGWYHQLINDPVAQLPLQMEPTAFQELVEKITNPNDKNLVSQFYTIVQENGTYVLDLDISETDRLTLIRIFTDAGYDFLGATLTRCRWALPSGTVPSAGNITHTLVTGVVNQVRWNKKSVTFEALDENINIAIGNTAFEALAALIASLSGNEGQEDVETLLNALQLGQLNGITDSSKLNRLETLQLALHNSTYRSLDGGNLWQVSLKPEKNGDQGSGEVNLPDELADQINELNILQDTYDHNNAEIDTRRTQIFMDWYRFMQVFHRGEGPDHGMSAKKMSDYIRDAIDALNELAEKNTTAEIDKKAAAIRQLLPEDYLLQAIAAPRYWQPTEPVVLFQGQSINPPARYGGDGRFMADNTLVCRLTHQLITQLTVPEGVLGNSSVLVFDKNNTPQLPDAMPLDYSEQVHDLFTENCLLNAAVVAALATNSGATMAFEEMIDIFLDNRNNYVMPPIPRQISDSEVERMSQIIAPSDFVFFNTLYEKSGDVYQLIGDESALSEKDKKQLDYIFISIGGHWNCTMIYAGLAPSDIYFVEWDGNPWLPFSLSWNINYYPLESIPGKDGTKNYPEEFIIKNFSLGDITYTHKGPIKRPTEVQFYENKIFMTPHAEENFQTQIRRFIEHQPDSPFDEELQEILNSMKNFPPILSQALNGLNNAMIMRNEVLQLNIYDPVKSSYKSFTNNEVKNAVQQMTQSSPNPGSFYNPIRSGVVRISSLTIVDAFGRNIRIQTPSNIVIAKDLKAEGLEGNDIYLPPRIVQPGRLQFRWLAANNDLIEMNTHPATTPIIGWLLANHLDSSLWLYANNGTPYGSLILSEDSQRVVWQSVPGGAAFGMDIVTFFETGPGKTANQQFKNLAIALYNQGNGDYLKAFMRANDLTFSLVQPQNFKQLGSNAVLMGSPIAVAQARLDFETMGLPAYNQSWEAMANEVNNGADRSVNGFTKVKFPVRLGAMEQINDGLLGYFKSGDYRNYYALHTDGESQFVKKPDETNITLTLDNTAAKQLVTLLFDPRGEIHATSGVLPVKSISIPPDQFADALASLKMAFLTTPVLTDSEKIGFPVPAEGGGQWTWLQNDLDRWSEAKEIAGVDDKANLPDSPQEIVEGWLVLTPTKK